jgi:hypothetical protein
MQRLLIPDTLKGFAVFLIIPVHILELFIDYPGRESLFGKTILFFGGPFLVPVFMLIMGYFLGRSKKSSPQVFFRGIKIFVLGFLLNIGLNFHLLLKIKFAGWQFNPLEYIFGVDILYLAGLSVVFISMIKFLPAKQGPVSIAAAFAVLASTGFMNQHFMVTERNYVLPFIAGTYSWSYFPLFPWLAYPLIGFSFSFWENRITRFIETQKKLFAIVLLVIATLTVFFGTFGISTTTTLPAYYHHTFGFAVWAIGVVILWVTVVRFFIIKFPKTLVGNFLAWLGKNITLFYIIQWLIIGNIATSIFQTQSIKFYPFWFAVIFSVTVVLTHFIGKTKIKLT